jgi:hypothetical protein
MRHIIVHNRGVVQDTKIFFEDIIKNAGIYNNGKYNQEIIEYFKCFFGKDQYSNTIILLKIPIKRNFPIFMEYNILDMLLSTLSASAHAIYEEVLTLEKGNNTNDINNN